MAVTTELDSQERVENLIRSNGALPKGDSVAPDFADGDELDMDEAAPVAFVSPRNTMNDLTGREWIAETKSVWFQKGLGANHPHAQIERQHPAPYSYQDILRLVRFFTKAEGRVLDPFVGVGSTLKACALSGRYGVGIELVQQWAELSHRRLLEEVGPESVDTQEIIQGDARVVLSDQIRFPDDMFDFMVCSPPYWAILNKKADHKVRTERLANSLATSYSEDSADLGNIEDYETFLNEVCGVFEKCWRVLKPGRYACVVVGDFRHKTRYVAYHADLIDRLTKHERGGPFELQGVTILAQNHKKLYPYGYPFAYVPNMHHQYILILRKPKTSTYPKSTSRSSRTLEKQVMSTCWVAPGVSGLVDEVERSEFEYAQKRLMERGVADTPTNRDSALQQFAQLPFKQRPYSARNWGHPLHSLCSYASKMKPAIASMLISFFTKPGSVVLDPFSGSGTVPFEACQQGRQGIAVDLSPLAFCLSSAKVDPPSPAQAETYMDRLDAYIFQTPEPRSAVVDAEVAEFYHSSTLREVILAKEFFERAESVAQVDPAHWFVKSCVLHILHGNRPYALSRRSHGIIPIPPKGPTVYKSLMVSLRDKVRRMGLARLPRDFRHGHAHLASAMELPIADGTVDAIITSPPFLGTTEFLRQNRLRLWFAGWNYDRQMEMKASGEFLEYHKSLDVYAEVLSELRRVIAPDGLVVMHLGVVKRVDMGQGIEAMANEHGFGPVDLIYEDATNLESHGRTDRGATHQHQFLFLRPI